MNKLLTIIAVAFITITSFGQNNNHDLSTSKMTENDSLYLVAIKKYIVEIDSFYNKYGQEKMAKVIHLQYEDYLTNLPDSLNGYKIQFITSENQEKIFRQNNNELYLVKVRPLSIKEGKFKITLVPYFAKLDQKNNYSYGLGSWTTIFFEYRDERLIYQKTRKGGI